MTSEEFLNLSNQHIYEFHFYHGRIAKGILVSEHSLGEEIIYLILPNKIQKMNEGNYPLKDIGEKINIETIIEFKAIER